MTGLVPGKISLFLHQALKVHDNFNRTIIHRAQIHHGLFGLGAPRKASGEASTLAIPQPQTPFLEPPAHVKSVGGTRIELLGVRFSLRRLELVARGHAGAYRSRHLLRLRVLILCRPENCI